MYFLYLLQKLVLGFVLICIALLRLGNGHLQSNPVDVTSFGAVGDGKTDDSKVYNPKNAQEYIIHTNVFILLFYMKLNNS